MQKSSWFMAMVGLFLAASLIWAFPAVAQLQRKGLLNSQKQGSINSSSDSFGYRSTIHKSQDSLGNQSWEKPDQASKGVHSDSTTHAPERPDHQPQSQTPGGTTIP